MDPHNHPHQTAPSRYFVRCLDCLSVAAIDARPTPELRCSLCDGRIENMGRVERDRLVHDSIGSPCDDRCTNAKGPLCSCHCHGKNHGSKRIVRITIDAGRVPKVQMPPSFKARPMAAEYQTARAAALEVLDQLTAQRRNGWMPESEYRRLRDVQTGLRKSVAARTHAARMTALTAVIPPPASPIRDFAEELRAQAPIATVPFALTAEVATAPRPKQGGLF